MLYLIFLLVSSFASLVGSICGIGGGVIIKPVLDAVGILDVATISFLSGCTVLSMTSFCVIKAQIEKASVINIKTSTILAIGAAVGGIVGKSIFRAIVQINDNINNVGVIQAICLTIITIGTLIYTIYQCKIRTKEIKSTFFSVMIGLFLGMLSSFLGIGGGPINLVALFYFFSMEIKVAAQNSLYIILFSQIASLISTILTKTIPEVNIVILILMVLGGIMGGVIGSIINKSIRAYRLKQLFITLMVVIILINIYNIYQFS